MWNHQPAAKRLFRERSLGMFKTNRKCKGPAHHWLLFKRSGALYQFCKHGCLKNAYRVWPSENPLPWQPNKFDLAKLLQAAGITSESLNAPKPQAAWSHPYPHREFTDIDRPTKAGFWSDLDPAAMQWPPDSPMRAYIERQHKNYMGPRELPILVKLELLTKGGA